MEYTLEQEERTVKKILLLLVLLLLCSCSEARKNNPSESESQPHGEALENNAEAPEQPKEGCSYIEHLYEKDVKSINCYNGTGAAILNDGSAVLWGTNVYGGIGNGEIDNDIPEGKTATPVSPYRLCLDEPIKDAGSVISSYALTESGTLYTWGLNNTYEAGIEGKPVLTPTKITEINCVKQVSTSTSFTLALKEDGTVYHAGVKMELFESAYDYDRYCLEYEQDKVFTKLPLDFKCKKIDTSGMSYLFLSDDGSVYIQGILLTDINIEKPDLVFNKPTKIDFPEKIVDAAVLTFNVVAVSETGRVYVFGCPGLGLSDEVTDTRISELIYKKNLENIKNIDGRHFVAGALSENGELYVWGIDTKGIITKESTDLPQGRLDVISEPVKLDYQNIVQICIGNSNGTAVSKDGEVYIWGDNSIGQIIDFE